MKRSFNKLLKSIFLSSIATLASAHGAEAIPDYKLLNDPEDDNSSDVKLAKKDNSRKMILKMGSDDGSYTLAAHRSHSSHRSHRSGSGGGHYSHSSHSSASSHYSSTTTSTPRVYSLGERTIRQGANGNDVKELYDLLVDKKFMKQPTTTPVTHTYDSAMVNAIKTFQREAKLQADGIAGPNTINALKEWKYIEYNLGDRVLKKGMFGNDVTQLRNILVSKGIIQGEAFTWNIIFDETIEAAVKKFQQSVELNVSGEVDEPTVAELKK